MENKLTLSGKSIPITGYYDVIVAGGGTSGAVAAISALKEGLRVLIIEQSGGLGGMQTDGLVTPTMGNGINGYPISPISREINGLLKETGDCITEAGGYEGAFNPVRMQTVLEELVCKYGGTILFHTTLIDTVMNAGKVEYAVMYNKGGISAVGGQTFIDCTGDADLCSMCGVSLNSGNADCVNQNISLRFEMAQVDITRYEAFMNQLCKNGGKEAFMREKFNEGYLREEDILHFQTFSIPGKPNCLSFNCPELGRAVNVIDPVYMSRQQIEGKKAVMKLADFSIKFIPGFEKSFVSRISPVLGIRESRRINAEYILTKDDIFAYRKFSDGIAVSNYPLDAHGDSDYGMGQGTYDMSVPQNKRYYEIPFRSLIAKDVDNLLCAGRCAGTDFYAQSSTRIQHTCHYMGEAAGIACALYVTAFKNIDGSDIRRKMKLRGAEILTTLTTLPEEQQ